MLLLKILYLKVLLSYIIKIFVFVMIYYFKNLYNNITQWIQPNNMV